MPSRIGVVLKITLRVMWRMLQTDKPDDYVLVINEFHSVREFVEKQFY